MAYKCNLIVDSCCDLPPEMINREGVRLVHFPFFLNDEEHLDDMWNEADMHGFYESMRSGAQPTTSQASAMELRDAYVWAAESGVPTLYLSFTSGLSSHFDSACRILDEVRAEYPDADLRIVDTRLASTGEAMLIYAALEQQERGLTIDEMEAWATEARDYVHVTFMVDDLTYLRRGGRVSAVAAIAGSMLDVKPLLTIDRSGALSVRGTSRGRKKAMKTLCEKFQENVDKSRPMVICMGHADCEKDMKRLEKLVRDAGFHPLFVEQPIGPVVGSHVGPGMISLCFWGKEPRSE